MKYPCEMKIQLCTNEWFRVYAIPGMGVQSFLQFFGGVCVAHLFRFFLCCSIMCLYVLSSVLLSKLRFPHTKHCSVCPVVCRRGVCLRIVMFNAYCVVFLVCFSSSSVPYVASFSGLSILYCLFRVL